MAKKAYFSTCPRCESKSFEHLADYAHCVECLYVEDGYEDVETAYLKAIRIALENNILEEEPTQPEQANELAS